MLGSYFGSTKIVQGAGALGDDGMLQAYSDGVVGGSPADADTPGLLFAYHDGSLGLGDDGMLQAYSDGVVGGTSADPDMPGLLAAYHDGSLGDDADPDTAIPIAAYHDGVLGQHFDPMSTYGNLQAFQDGSLGLGADATAAPALDLGDQKTLAEVKALIAYASGGYALSAAGQQTYTPDFYTSGIWEPSASTLWQMVVSATPAFSGETVSGSADSQTYPNGNGIAYLYAAAAAPTTTAMGPTAAAAAFPTIAAWLNAKGTSVLAPYLSITDKAQNIRGSSEAGMSGSTMAMWGLGAAALLGLALVFGRKKR